jgi:hypothetical protein
MMEAFAAARPPAAGPGGFHQGAKPYQYRDRSGT